MRHIQSPQDRDSATWTEARWVESRLETRGLGGFGRRLALQAAAVKNRHFARQAIDGCGVLIYRRLTPDLPGATQPTLNVTPERFRAQLIGLLKRGRVFWPLDKIIDFQKRQWRVMPWVTAVTFDIGFAGIYSHAWPILRDLKIPATVLLESEHFRYETRFPADGWAERNRDQTAAESCRPLNSAECSELAHSGLISFGSCAPTGTCAADGSLAFDDRLFRGLATLAWQRIQVVSWDTSATLATRLARASQSTQSTSHPTTATIERPGEKPQGGPAPSTVPAAARTADRATVSVIVPTYNRAQWIGEALQSLIDQETDDGFSFDIHVVDNASSDETPAVIARLAAQSPVKIHVHRQTLPGDAPTRNCGVAHSTGQWLAFFDDDQLAEPSWLRELWSATAGGERPIVGGAVHLHLNQRELAALDPLCRAALRETRLYATARPYRRTDLPGTGNALVARAVFDAIGNFDESMRGGGSDCDFFTRARDAGFPLWYTPTAVIRHRVSAERLSPEFLRWDALSGGAEHAGYFDFQRKGLTALLGLCGARLVQALLIHLPLLVWARLRGDTHAALGRQTSLWRTEGYVRRTLSIIAPAWFAQPHFFESLDLRQGRSLCR